MQPEPVGGALMAVYSADWLLTPGQTPMQHGAVEIDKAEGRITGLISEVEFQSESGTTFLTPGLINAHSHLELTADKPIPIEAGESMADWILKVIGQSREMDETRRRQACQKSILEMIRTGTTCVNDITSTGASLASLSQVGMRGVVSPEFFHPGHADDPDVTAIVARFNELKAYYAQHPLLEVGVSPHSPYNVTPWAAQKVIEATSPVLVHTHLAETRDEIRWFETGASDLDRIHRTILGQTFGPVKTGESPVSIWREQLDAHWIAAHGVHLTDADIALLVEKGVSLVHCPRSNQWLSGETIPDLKRLQQAGIPLGLGTDSRLSCPDLDIRAEGREVQRLHGLSAKDVFQLMTAGSAAAMKKSHLLGQLQAGFEADLVVWWNPNRGITDPYEAWLSPETEVQQVLIGGRTVLERELVD